MFGSDTLDVVVNAALEAGKALLEMQRSAKKVTKSRRDFVTDADHRSDAVIRKILGDHFAIYSEEGGGDLGHKGNIAVVDALDGTVNYWCGGSRLWAVSIGILKDGVPTAGVIYAPHIGRLYAAHKNLAAKYKAAMNKGAVVRIDAMHPFSPSKSANLAESRVDTDWIKGDPEIVIQILRILNDNTILPGIPGCVSMSMMRVAAGELDGYVHAGPMPEDHAAAGLIVQNAGGKVTELDGSPWTPFSKTVVATNGLIHDELIHVLNR